MTLDLILGQAVLPALQLLPPSMDSQPARRMLLAIGLQESEFRTRTQIMGPARGFWQFERPGGVRGVLRHAASRSMAMDVCRARGVAPNEWEVYNRLAGDDVLSAAFARLLLWTDPKPLPTEASGAWDLYARTWRPGKPHPEKWPDNYRKATEAVMG